MKPIVNNLAAMNRPTYCLDTTALLFMADFYSADTFPEVWMKLGDLVLDKVIMAPKEVQRELEKTEDNGALTWANSHKSLFRPLDANQAEIAAQIVNARPLSILVDFDSELPNADPFVFALAATAGFSTDMFSPVGNVSVVATKSSPNRVGLEDVCTARAFQGHGVEFLTPYQMLIEIGQDVPEPGGRGLAELYGIWQGVDFTEEEIRTAKLGTRGLEI